MYMHLHSPALVLAKLTKQYTMAGSVQSLASQVAIALVMLAELQQSVIIKPHK